MESKYSSVIPEILKVWTENINFVLVIQTKLGTHEKRRVFLNIHLRLQNRVVSGFPLKHFELKDKQPANQNFSQKLEESNMFWKKWLPFTKKNTKKATQRTSRIQLFESSNFV